MGDVVRADERNRAAAENETHPSAEQMMDQLREELREELRAELRTELAARRNRGSSRRQILRRGGVPIGAGLAAAAALRRPAAAADGAPILQSQFNSGSGTTTVSTSGANESALEGRCDASSSYGVRGTAWAPTGTGVLGITGATSGAPIGVLGATSAPEGWGVIGRNLASTGSSVGVAGETDGAAGAGVFGTGPATDALGVWAIPPAEPVSPEPRTPGSADASTAARRRFDSFRPALHRRNAARSTERVSCTST